MSYPQCDESKLLMHCKQKLTASKTVCMRMYWHHYNQVSIQLEFNRCKMLRTDSHLHTNLFYIKTLLLNKSKDKNETVPLIALK